MLPLLPLINLNFLGPEALIGVVIPRRAAPEDLYLKCSCSVLCRSDLGQAPMYTPLRGRLGQLIPQYV